MYRSRSRSAETSARVWMVWMYVLGRVVRDNPDDIARERSWVVREDSLPPFNIAALPGECCLYEYAQ